jgi:hypothetical protein
MGIWVLGCLGIWVFGYLGVWVFGYLGGGCLVFGVSGSMGAHSLPLAAMTIRIRTMTSEHYEEDSPATAPATPSGKKSNNFRQLPKYYIL